MTASKNNILRNLMKRRSRKSKSCQQELLEQKSTAFHPYLLDDHESTDARRKDDENTKKKWSRQSALFFQSSRRSWLVKSGCEEHDTGKMNTKRTNHQEQQLYYDDQWSDGASIESLSSVNDSDLADRFLIAY